MAWRKVWIWERSLESGTKYVLRWHDEQGRIRSETVGTDRKLAERLRHQKEYELNAGLLNESPEVDYQEFKRGELDRMKGRVAESTLVGLELTLRNFRELTGVEKLSDITTAVIEDYMAERLEDVSRATVNKNFRTLKAALNRAVNRGQLPENPADGIKQIPEPEREVRVLSVEEIKTLLEAAPSLRWRALIALGVYTGMRRGEMLALRWKDLDLQDGSVKVKNTEEHHTKNWQNRTLPLPEVLCRLLRKLPHRGDRVFTTRDGNPWKNNLHRDFRQIVKKQGSSTARSMTCAAHTFLTWR